MPKKTKIRTLRVISDMDMIIGNDDLQEIYVFTNHKLMQTKQEIIINLENKRGITYDAVRQCYLIEIGSPADIWLRLYGL
jgi:hypothetical protein